MDFGALYNGFMNAVGGVVGGVEHALGMNTSAPPPPQTPTQAPAPQGQAPNPTLNIAQLGQAMQESHKQLTPQQQASQNFLDQNGTVDPNYKSPGTGLLQDVTNGLIGSEVQNLKNENDWENQHPLLIRDPKNPRMSIMNPDKSVQMHYAMMDTGMAAGVEGGTAPVDETGAAAIGPRGRTYVNPTDTENAIRPGSEPPKTPPPVTPLPAAPTTPLGAVPQIKPVEEPPAPPAPPSQTVAKSGFDQAVSALHDFYNSNIGPQSGIGELLSKANGTIQLGQRLAGQLGQSIKSALPDAADRRTLTHVLDGTIDPSSVSPDIQHVATQLDQLNSRGLDVRQLANPGTRQVKNYSTRMVTSINKRLAGSSGQGGIKGAITNLRDAFNVNSRFSLGRNIQKFTAPDGSTQIGVGQRLGLKQNPDTGMWTDAKGKVYQPGSASIQEIEDAGAATYEKDNAKTSAAYHADTAALKGRVDAISELKNNPEQYGLTPGKDGTVPPGNVEIEGVPELEGYSAPPKVAKQIEDNFKSPRRIGIIERTWQGVNNLATQFIVFNPAIHGLNLAVQAAIQSGNMPLFKGGSLQAGPIGILKHAASFTRFLTDAGAREGMIRQYFKDGGHTMTYGRDQRTWISNVLDHTPLEGANKINSTAMSGIETAIRATLHDANVKSGMKPTQSVKMIDTFLGHKQTQGIISKNLGMFWHWTQTQGRAIGTQVGHPVQNAGANANALLMVGLYFAVQKAWQDVTGNKNAHVSARGEIGLAERAIHTGGDVLHGAGEAVVGDLTSLVNPGVNAILNQVANKNLYTGQQFHGAGDRLGNLASTLVAPAGPVSKTASGAKSIPELALNEFGAYIPHVKGAPGAPNLPVLNTAGANPINDGSGDVTGYSQAQAYYTQRAAALSSLKQVPDQNAFNDAFSKMVDPTGRPIMNGPHDSLSINQELYAHPAALQAMQTMQKSIAQQTGQPLDPKWQLSGNGTWGGQNMPKIQVYANYEGSLEGSAQKAAILQLNPWITDLTNARQAFFTAHPAAVGNDVANPNTPKYPTFDPQTTQLLNQYNTADLATKDQMMNNDPQLSIAFGQINQWENQQNLAQGGNGVPQYPTADPSVEATIKAYMALPASKSGGNTNPATNKERSNWIKANPQAYANMSNYLAQVSAYNLQKQAGIDFVIGGGPSQKTLKYAQQLGQDVVKNPNGTYSISPSAAYAASGGGGGSSSGGKDTIPYQQAPDLRPLRFTTGTRGKSRHLSFKVQRGPKLKTIHQGGAPARKGTLSNGGVKSSNDTIKSS